MHQRMMEVATHPAPPPPHTLRAQLANAANYSDDSDDDDVNDDDGRTDTCKKTMLASDNGMVEATGNYGGSCGEESGDARRDLCYTQHRLVGRPAETARPGLEGGGEGCCNGSNTYITVVGAKLMPYQNPAKHCHTPAKPCQTPAQAQA